MPYNYRSPGVYIEELDRGPRPIQAASTSVLAMIGICREAITVLEPDEERPGQLVTKLQPVPTDPTLVTNWSEFTQYYGDFDQAYPGGYLHQSMFGHFLNGGTSTYIVGLPLPVTERKEPNVPTLTSGEAFLVNSSNQKLVRVSTAALKVGEQVTIEIQPAGDGTPAGVFNLLIKRAGSEPKTIPNVTLEPKPPKDARKITDLRNAETGDLKFEVMEGSEAATTDRVPDYSKKVALVQLDGNHSPAKAIPELKGKLTTDLFTGRTNEGGIRSLEAVEEVTLLASPDLVAARQWGVFEDKDVQEVQQVMLDHCSKMKDRFAILDCPPGLNLAGIKKWRSELNSSMFGALYYPWIEIKKNEFVPPSGYLAGVYSRVDSERGVHKAPANETIRGVIGLERRLSRNEQDELNPISINCIRSFPNQGIRIWGARTLADSKEAQWRYINVRRLFSSVEKSILQGTSWVVFEPNNPRLWLTIRRDITSYLTTLWETGALFGNTPEQAFYVKCDEETNPPRIRDLGYCVIEIGIAPVKPAEFVVFRVSQKDDGSGATTE